MALRPLIFFRGRPTCVCAALARRWRTSERCPCSDQTGVACTDSLVVVNVALNDTFEGARLLFATADGIEAPERRTGDATVHDCTVVHGVSRLATGVRYNLFAVYEATSAVASAAA